MQFPTTHQHLPPEPLLPWEGPTTQQLPPELPEDLPRGAPWGSALSAPWAPSPAPRAAPGASPAPRRTGWQMPDNAIFCTWKADDQSRHIHIPLTGFNFISHRFDNGNWFLSPHFGVGRLQPGALWCWGAAGAGCRHCGGHGPPEVTQIYGLEAARLSVWVSVVHLPAFDLLPKKVFPPSLDVREGREGSGDPDAAAPSGHIISSHRGIWIF